MRTTALAAAGLLAALALSGCSEEAASDATTTAKAAGSSASAAASSAADAAGSAASSAVGSAGSAASSASESVKAGKVPEDVPLPKGAKVKGTVEDLGGLIMANYDLVDPKASFTEMKSALAAKGWQVAEEGAWSDTLTSGTLTATKDKRTVRLLILDKEMTLSVKS
ncbi:hypothetical protein ACQP1U_02295 [Actinomycetota bacterium]